MFSLFFQKYRKNRIERIREDKQVLRKSRRKKKTRETRRKKKKMAEEEENDCCPLCMEELDLTDKTFNACPCGYQVSYKFILQTRR